MARLLRVEYPGACYHVINRGNDRRNLFAGKGAAEAFELTLDEAALRFGWKVHAYVIMRNHFHLALELNEPNLSVGMKWLQGTWTRRNDALRSVEGRLFQGRFKAIIVEPGAPLAKVGHYIHLNPLRANLVTRGRLADYRWSSLSRFSHKPRAPWLEGETVLSNAGGLPDNPAGWRRYQAYLATLSEDKIAGAELTSARLSRGWCVGSSFFKTAVRKKLEKRGSLLQMTRSAKVPPDEVEQERAAHWERRLRALARVAKIDVKELSPKKSDTQKVLLAAALKQSTSVSNIWLAHRLAMGQPASVSQFVRRSMQDDTGRAQVQALLSKVKL